MDEQKSPKRRGPKVLGPITIDGRIYQPQRVIENKYDISDGVLRWNRKNGLPCMVVGGHNYFNEDDFHRYFSGEIGGECEKQ